MNLVERLREALSRTASCELLPGDMVPSGKGLEAGHLA